MTHLLPLRIGAVVVCVLVVACLPHAAPEVSSSPTPHVSTPAPSVPSIVVGPPTSPLADPNTVAVPDQGTCHSVAGLPDRQCTPGLLNPDLTPAQLCAPGFTTRTIRPPVEYTNALKARLMLAYGIPVERRSINGVQYSTADFYELDHDVALEDGGHPWSPLNLWPQPRKRTIGTRTKPSVDTNLPGPWAEDKDRVETTTKKQICADPADALRFQTRLGTDWTGASTAASAQDESTDPPKEQEP